MGRLLNESDVYALFDRRGMAQLHVGDIDVLPRVEAKPIVHARWIVEFDDKGWKKHSCSNCDYFRRTDVHVSLNWYYCPYCGAQMDAEEA